MTFKDSLHIVSTDVFVTLVMPEWVMGVTERTSKLRTALRELKVGAPPLTIISTLTLLHTSCTWRK